MNDVAKKETTVVPFAGGNPTVEWIVDNGAMLPRHYFAGKGVPLNRSYNHFIMVKTSARFCREWVVFEYTSQSVYASLESHRLRHSGVPEWGHIKGTDTVYSVKFLDKWFNNVFLKEFGVEYRSPLHP